MKTGMNTKRLGKHQKKCLEFAMRNSGWHSFAADALTLRVVKSLEARGCLSVAWLYHQFRYSDVNHGFEVT